MKRRYSDTIASHKFALAIPIVVAIVVSMFMAHRAHKTYQSITNIWGDASIPNPSTVDQATSGTAPSTNYANVLTELLKTHAFLLSLADDTPMADYVKTHSGSQVDAALASIPKAFTIATPGPQLMSVMVKQPTPAMAVALAKAIDHQFPRQVTDTLAARSQALVDYDKQQLDDAQAALNAAQSQLLQYVQSHPGNVGNQLDSTANQLTGLVAAAQQQYSTAQSKYNEAQVALNHVRSNSSLSVFDPPSPATRLSSKKTLMLTGGGAVVGGIVVSVALLLYLTASDRTARREQDLADALSLRVVGTIGEMPGRRRPQAGTVKP